jgi:hypothetical protein
VVLRPVCVVVAGLWWRWEVFGRSCSSRLVDTRMSV